MKINRILRDFATYFFLLICFILLVLKQPGSALPTRLLSPITEVEIFFRWYAICLLFTILYKFLLTARNLFRKPINSLKALYELLKKLFINLIFLSTASQVLLYTQRNFGLILFIPMLFFLLAIYGKFNRQNKPLIKNLVVSFLVTVIFLVAGAILQSDYATLGGFIQTSILSTFIIIFTKVVTAKLKIRLPLGKFTNWKFQKSHE
jgi:hypothetical protein